MKTIILIISLFSIAGCVDNSYKATSTNTLTAKRWTIFLKRVKTNLTITLPLEYDTILTWKEAGCQCISNKYRIQNKKNPIYFDGCCADSAVPYNKLQMTIQEPLYSFDSTAIVNNETIIRNHRQNVLYSQNDPQTRQTQYDTILTYQDKVFSIFSNIVHDINHSVFRQTLETTVYLGGLPVRITFEQSFPKLPLDRTIFINNCISTIKSITTSNGT